ncbi:MAG: M13 family metallopeptidase [Brevundimonas sp.]|nr:M13 family metallopeptidase [Brevundimonas sp.]
MRSLLLTTALISAALLAGPAPAQELRPGADFDAFANADWYRTTPMPEGEAALGTTALLRERAAGQVRELLAEAVRAPTSPAAQRVGDLYSSLTGTEAIEARGLEPLAADLAAIAAIRDRAGLSAYLGASLSLDDGTNSRTPGVLGVWFHQSPREARVVPHLMQGGLGLPADALRAELPSAAYRARIAAVLTLAGLDRPQARADRVVALERALARTHAPAEQASDPHATDNPWTRADLAARAPGMDWSAWLTAAGLERQADFNVWHPSAVTGLAALVADQPVEAWRDYLTYHHLGRYAAALPVAFRQAFAGPDGAPPQRPAVALEVVETHLGQDLSRLWAADHFPPASKAAAEDLVTHILTAWRARLTAASFLSPEASATALAKLDTLKVDVGHPDRWLDTSDLVIRRDEAYANLRRAEVSALRRERARLDQPVDMDDWGSLLPHRVGAILNFSPNTMQFTAGILQPPYFDPAGDAASNYGSAGAGLAHEVGHTFDPIGADYDPEGRLVRWWSDADRAAYDAAVAPLHAQLAAYCLKPDLCVTPDRVLSETAADLAGLNVAYDAYKLSLNGRPDTVIDGLTGDQRFFLAFARRWRRLQTEAGARRQFATDNHAPGPYRAATVRNHDAWYAAFDIRPGDPLYLPPEQRVRIW